MADEFEDIEELEGQPISTYEQLVTQEGERGDGIEESGAPPSLSEAEDEKEDKSDLQTAMRVLLPTYKNPRINELLKSAMVGRIFPDNFIDKHFLITASLIEEIDPEDDVDVVGIISQVQDGLSIGYEGKGRIDILEIAGVAHEEEMEKLSKELGL
ncbi:hypothetical protein LCGC14_0341320 [marine sediment metagenome]|uniref:Uncharacterized protein n=1 Tax=marine sediment metagenome TaxID=412755 RepID=A0A0F9TDN1_9ZZZZ